MPRAGLSLSFIGSAAETAAREAAAGARLDPSVLRLTPASFAPKTGAEWNRTSWGTTPSYGHLGWDRSRPPGRPARRSRWRPVRVGGIQGWASGPGGAGSARLPSPNEARSLAGARFRHGQVRNAKPAARAMHHAGQRVRAGEDSRPTSGGLGGRARRGEIRLPGKPDYASFACRSGAARRVSSSACAGWRSSVVCSPPPPATGW